MAFLFVSQEGELKNAIKTFGEVHVKYKYFLPKKLRKKKNPDVFSPWCFFIAFLAVALHEELKNTTIVFPKTRPKNLKNLTHKKAGG
jgi:hypothetical protein